MCSLGGMGLKVLLTPVNSENVSLSTLDELSAGLAPARGLVPLAVLVVIIDNILEAKLFMLLLKSAAVVFFHLT